MTEPVQDPTQQPAPAPPPRPYAVIAPAPPSRPSPVLIAVVVVFILALFGGILFIRTKRPTPVATTETDTGLPNGTAAPIVAGTPERITLTKDGVALMSLNFPFTANGLVAQLGGGVRENPQGTQSIISAYKLADPNPVHTAVISIIYSDCNTFEGNSPEIAEQVIARAGQTPGHTAKQVGSNTLYIYNARPEQAFVYGANGTVANGLYSAENQVLGEAILGTVSLSAPQCTRSE